MNTDILGLAAGFVATVVCIACLEYLKRDARKSHAREMTKRGNTNGNDTRTVPRADAQIK